MISLQVPNYYKIIKHPMDLTLVKRKLQRKHPLHYKSTTEFVSDVRLVFSNCAKFNEVSTGNVLNLCGGCDGMLHVRNEYLESMKHTKATQHEHVMGCMLLLPHVFTSTNN